MVQEAKLDFNKMNNCQLRWDLIPLFKTDKLNEPLIQEKSDFRKLFKKVKKIEKLLLRIV
jgi:hypothetical protein